LAQDNSRSERGKDLGKTRLDDALSRSMTAADAIAARAILVHATDTGRGLYLEHANR
jgi:hypothetical protein